MLQQFAPGHRTHSKKQPFCRVAFVPFQDLAVENIDVGLIEDSVGNKTEYTHAVSIGIVQLSLLIGSFNQVCEKSGKNDSIFSSKQDDRQKKISPEPSVQIRNLPLPNKIRDVGPGNKCGSLCNPRAAIRMFRALPKRYTGTAMAKMPHG